MLLYFLYHFTTLWIIRHWFLGDLSPKHSASFSKVLFASAGAGSLRVSLSLTPIEVAKAALNDLRAFAVRTLFDPSFKKRKLVS